MKNWLISVFDYTGNMAKAFEQKGWDVTQIDIQHGFDFFNFDWKAEYNNRNYGDKAQVGIVIQMPCTDYATSSAKHFAAKDLDGRTAQSQKLLSRVCKMITWFDYKGVLKFWVLENPRTRIHTLNPWLGKIKQKFNPCDFAGYDPNPDDSRYNKETWLFGEFALMVPKPMPPLSKENPGWKNLGGKSLKTKNARSIAPLGYCYALAESNT